MKISKKDKKLLLYAGGILPLVLAYFMVFVPFGEKNDIQMSENQKLLEELELRRTWDANKDTYRDETERMQGEIQQTLLTFPADILEEDVLLYANSLERGTKMEIADVSIGTSSQLYCLGQGMGTAADTGIYLNGHPVVYTFTSSYDALKRNIQTIQQDEETRNVEQLILSFDNTSGKLVGSMTVNMYSVQGNGKMYQSPEVPNMTLEVNNLFGTTTTVTEEE